MPEQNLVSHVCWKIQKNSTIPLIFSNLMAKFVFYPLIKIEKIDEKKKKLNTRSCSAFE